MARFGSRFDPVRLLGWSRVAYGLGWLIIVNVLLLPLIVAVQLALAPANIGWSASQQTLLQTAAEDRFRGRIFGAMDTITALMGIVGIGIGSSLGDAVGIVPLYNLSALLYAAAGVVALVQLQSLRPWGAATRDWVRREERGCAPGRFSSVPSSSRWAGATFGDTEATNRQGGLSCPCRFMHLAWLATLAV